MDKQYKERGLYKVRQDGTKEFVPFKTREEWKSLVEEKKRRAWIVEQVFEFVQDMNDCDIDFKMSATPRDWRFQLRDGKDFWEFSADYRDEDFNPSWERTVRPGQSGVTELDEMGCVRAWTTRRFDD